MHRIYENEILRLQVILNYSKGRKGQTAKLLLLCGNIYKSYHNCPSAHLKTGLRRLPARNNGTFVMARSTLEPPIH